MNIRLEVLLNKIGITKKKIKAAVKEAARTEYVEKEKKMRTYLKIKNMSLAAEARIIRQQERKLKGWRYKYEEIDGTTNGVNRISNPRWRPIAQSNGDLRSKLF